MEQIADVGGDLQDIWRCCRVKTLLQIGDCAGLTPNLSYRHLYLFAVNISTYIRSELTMTRTWHECVRFWETCGRYSSFE